MYSTFGGQEALLATAAGLEPSDFEKIKATEQRVIDRAIERESTHPRITDVSQLYSDIEYSTPMVNIVIQRKLKKNINKKNKQHLKDWEKKLPILVQ